MSYRLLASAFLAACLLTGHAAKCTYSLSPSSVLCPVGGTTSTIAMVSGTGCGWAATTTNTWIHTSSSGSGNGTIVFTADANNGDANRVGAITAGGTVVTITQGGPLGGALEATNLVWTTDSQYPWISTASPSFDGVESAVSGNQFVPNSTSWIQTTVVGPGTLTFWWKVDSDVTGASYDFLEFLINGQRQEQIMGLMSWSFRSYVLPEGTNALTWQYVKDGTYNSGWDQAWLDSVTFSTNLPIPLYQALDTCGAEWSSGGNNNITYWTGTTEVSHDGLSSARSGAIMPGQESWLETTVSGITNLSFWWKVSSQTNTDYLEFYTNSVLAHRISGEVDWRSNSFRVSPATQVLRWRFVRASTSGVSGQNCGWVDHVIFDPPLAPTVLSYQTNLTLSLPVGSCTALLPDLTGPESIAVADTCSSVSISQLPPAGTALPAGVSTVVISVSGSQGQTALLTNNTFVVDTTAPQILLSGGASVTNECHTIFADPGATAGDDCSGVLSLTTNSTVNPNQVGIYTIQYIATDAAGNASTNTRTVYVRDTQPPVVTLVGPDPMQVECHSSFADPGATASDSCAGPLSVSTTGSVNPNSPGTYVLTYTASDGFNTASVSRTVHVVDTTSPQILASFSTLILSADANCSATLPNLTGPTYITATDLCGTVTITQLPVAGTALPPGTNAVVLTATDGSANSISVTNKVVVKDATAPTLLLLGFSPLTNECHTPLVDPGATASDNCSGLLSLTTNSTVNPDQVGIYAIQYIATDAAGNASTNTRTVYVRDTQPPILTLIGPDPMQVECHGTFSDPGAAASDSCAGPLTVSTTGSVNPNSPGAYVLRYTASDGFNTASMNRTVYVVDTTPPQIVSSFGTLVLTAGVANCSAVLPNLSTYITATDLCGSVTITQMPLAGTTLPLGTNAVVLMVADESANSLSITNTVVVNDATPPILLLLGNDLLTNECHAAFIDPGAIASDNCSGLLSLVTNSTVNPNEVGVYAIQYIATDAAGNASTNTRTVHVRDTQPPILTLIGPDPMQVECHGTFADPGATASDSCAGPLSVSTTGSVSPNSPGAYTLTYTASDGFNTASITRTVHVLDTTPPQIVSSFGTLVLTAGVANCSAVLPNLSTYITATDLCGSVTITQTPLEGTSLPLGGHGIELTVADPSGNLVRITNQVDIVEPPPVISIQPQSATNQVGQPLTLSVVAQACTPPAYQWYYQNQLLPGASGPALTLTNVQSCAAGEYFTVVIGASGSVTSAVAALSVLNVPLAIEPGGVAAIGTQTECGNLILAGGSSYNWDISDPLGVPGTGWDLVHTSGSIQFQAGSSPFKINVVSLPLGAATMENFDPAANYIWTLATSPEVMNFDPSVVTVDTTGFTVAATGTFRVGTNSAGLALIYEGRLVTPLILGQVLRGDNRFEITFSGPTGQAYRVLATSDLSQPLEAWAVVTGSRFGTNAEVFIDSESSLRNRFYRVVSP